MPRTQTPKTTTFVGELEPQRKATTLIDLPTELLQRIMLLTMATDEQKPHHQTPQPPFLDASNRHDLRDGISLAVTCVRMIDVFHQSLTAIKLISSWQAEQPTLTAACRVAAVNLRALHVECSAPVTAALRHVVNVRPPMRHFVLIGVNISKALMADMVTSVGPTLTRLTISAAPSLDDTIVKLISMRCQKLQYIELGGSRGVDSQSLIYLFRRLGHTLKGIEINSLHHDTLDEEVMFAIALNCDRLSCLRLLKLKWVNDVGLACLFQMRAHQLTEFRLEQCRHTSLNTLPVLGRNGTGLEKLTFTFEKAAWISAHASLLSLASDLDRSLDNQHSSNSSSPILTSGEKALVQITRSSNNLRSLSISDVSLSDSAVEHFARACGPTLRVLHLRHCSSLGNDAMRSLAKHTPQLILLDLAFLPLLQDDGLRYVLSSLESSLEELQIVGCRSLTDKTLLENVPRFGKCLRIIRLTYCNFSQRAISALRRELPRITISGASHCTTS